MADHYETVALYKPGRLNDLFCGGNVCQLIKIIDHLTFRTINIPTLPMLIPFFHFRFIDLRK